VDIKGKTALVTGAASGIGRATALMLAERGASKIVIADADEARLPAVADALQAAGATPIMKVADLCKVEAVTRLFEEADQETGGLDIVFNNAGRITRGPDFPDCDLASMVAVIQLNLIAVMVGTYAAVQLMRRRGAPGVIVNTSSKAAFSDMPADPAYCASKYGVLGLTRSCKPLHDAFNIRVMAICPGLTDTPLLPKDAGWLSPYLPSVILFTPEDIAREVVRIVEDDTLAGEHVLLSERLVSA